MKTVKRETWKNERSRRTNTPTDLSGVFTPCVFFFLQNSAMGKLPSLQPLRGPLSARSVVCKEGNIWMRSCVRAVRKSVTARFLLFLFLTLSFVNFLSCSLAHFSVSHFLISSLFTFSLAELLTFSISELSISKPWELNCRSTSERSKH